MILFPRIGEEYWIVTGYRGKFYAVPVRLVDGELGRFLGRWTIGGLWKNYYNKLRRRNLYKEYGKAVKVARMMNGRAE